MFALQDRTITSQPTISIDWSQASCAASVAAGSTPPTELFFSDELPAIRAAKAICATCPLVDPCLTGAVERREPWGVWGGQLFKDGKVLAVKRPRGRPPKDPSRRMTA